MSIQSQIRRIRRKIKRFVAVIIETWQDATLTADLIFDDTGIHEKFYRFSIMRWSAIILSFFGGLKVLLYQSLCRHERVERSNYPWETEYAECEKCGKQWPANRSDQSDSTYIE